MTGLATGAGSTGLAALVLVGSMGVGAAALGLALATDVGVAALVLALATGVAALGLALALATDVGVAALVLALATSVGAAALGLALALALATRVGVAALLALAMEAAFARWGSRGLGLAALASTCAARADVVAGEGSVAGLVTGSTVLGRAGGMPGSGRCGFEADAGSI